WGLVLRGQRPHQAGPERDPVLRAFRICFVQEAARLSEVQGARTADPERTAPQPKWPGVCARDQARHERWREAALHGRSDPAALRESSETIRQTLISSEEMVRSAWRHAE